MMTLFNFITKSIVFYRKQHLALFLGMAVSAAVLTGAFVIGDSIRFSLEDIVSTRLGNTRFVVMGGSRFMEADLAGKLSRSLQVPVTPLLMLRGIAIAPETGELINKTGVIGIDSTFNSISKLPISLPANNEAVISSNLAERLKLKAGEEIILRIENISLIPVNAPFAKEVDPTIALRLKIRDIASEDQLGRLNLGNDQSEVYNIFVSRHFLARRLDLTGLSNIFIIAGKENPLVAKAVEDSLQAHWTLKDMGITMMPRLQTNELDLSSSRVFIDSIVSHTIAHEKIPCQQVISYMVNGISLKNRHIPYSFASGVTESMAGEPLKNHEIILNRWAADDLKASAGDSVTISYYEIGAMRELRETSRNFIVKNIIPTITPGIDSSLMPKFQGLSEAGNCRDWDAGVPIDLKSIRDKDEKYWDQYRGTPKVLLSLNTAKTIWKNPFGTHTKIRVDASKVSPAKLESVLLTKIKPSALGIQVIDVHHEGASAAENAVNFTELFLGLSFFIIGAGMLLTILIYSLHFDRRSSETALLKGFGFSAGTIIRMRFMESALVIVAGSIAGSLLGILYNYGLIAALNSVWNDIVRTDMLQVHVSFLSLLMGAGISIIVALLPVYLVTQKKLKRSVASELKGYTSSDKSVSVKHKRSIRTGIALLGASILMVVFSVVSNEYNNAALYLTSASLVLAGSLFTVYGLLRNNAVNENSVPTISSLAYKNLKRNASRSVAVIALLAIGTFAIILTGSYRKTYYGEEMQRKSGTGGYLLWAETTSPLPVNLNASDGRNKLIIEKEDDLNNVRFLQFERLEGDDASCLNLNQAQRPRILAVNPAVFDSAGAFSFGRLQKGISEDHPWKGLEASYNDSTFPAYADQNVIQYSLKKKIGDTLIYLNEAGNRLYLILAGALQNSVFQGNILVNNKMFRQQFPSTGGSKTILVDAPLSQKTTVMDILSKSLVDYGIEVTPTSERLATFNSVENTYLTVFMALSGLGFIIGTIGLGIVLLRNIFERRQELAVMTSIGFSRNKIFKIVFTENLILLVTGFGIGILSALLGILPSLLSPSFHIQGLYLLVLISGMMLSGVAWICFPLFSALKRPLISSLRNE
jgi:ABC-type antimicrobial peptide transport system permease subunit